MYTPGKPWDLGAKSTPTSGILPVFPPGSSGPAARWLGCSASPSGSRCPGGRGMLVLVSCEAIGI
jgi:hypothetical protein